jgi:hypothetical protein
LLGVYLWPETSTHFHREAVVSERSSEQRVLAERAALMVSMKARWNELALSQLAMSNGHVKSAKEASSE